MFTQPGLMLWVLVYANAKQQKLRGDDWHTFRHMIVGPKKTGDKEAERIDKAFRRIEKKAADLDPVLYGAADKNPMSRIARLVGYPISAETVEACAQRTRSDVERSTDAQGRVPVISLFGMRFFFNSLFTGIQQYRALPQSEPNIFLRVFREIETLEELSAEFFQQFPNKMPPAVIPKLSEPPFPQTHAGREVLDFLQATDTPRSIDTAYILQTIFIGSLWQLALIVASPEKGSYFGDWPLCAPDRPGKDCNSAGQKWIRQLIEQTKQYHCISPDPKRGRPSSVIPLAEFLRSWDHEGVVPDRFVKQLNKHFAGKDRLLFDDVNNYCDNLEKANTQLEKEGLCKDTLFGIRLSGHIAGVFDLVTTGWKNQLGEQSTDYTNALADACAEWPVLVSQAREFRERASAHQ